MAYTISGVLSDPLITVMDRHDEIGSFAVKLGSLSKVISIELGRHRTTDITKFRLSHVVHTPVQTGPYKTSSPWDSDWESALHKAVSSLTMHYQQAVAAGHTPIDSWLVEY